MIIRTITKSDATPEFIETLRSLNPDLSDSYLEEIDLVEDNAYVALIDGEVVGTASLTCDRHHHQAGKFSGRIEDVAVRKDMQGKGIGLALIQHAIEQAKSFKFYKITLSCFPELTEFYKKCGFYRHDIGMRIDL
jgi:GNAT superfamily N-acetyltransferase